MLKSGVLGEEACAHEGGERDPPRTTSNKTTTTNTKQTGRNNKAGGETRQAKMNTQSRLTEGGHRPHRTRSAGAPLRGKSRVPVPQTWTPSTSRNTRQATGQKEEKRQEGRREKRKAPLPWGAVTPLPREATSPYLVFHAACPRRRGYGTNLGLTNLGLLRLPERGCSV